MDAQLDRELPEIAGIWVKYPDGLRIRVARAGGANAAYVTALADAMRPYAVAIEAGALPAAADRWIVARAYAGGVVREWTGQAGLPALDTPEAADWLLANGDVFDDLLALAPDAETFTGAPREVG